MKLMKQASADDDDYMDSSPEKSIGKDKFELNELIDTVNEVGLCIYYCRVFSLILFIFLTPFTHCRLNMYLHITAGRSCTDAERIHH